MSRPLRVLLFALAALLLSAEPASAGPPSTTAPADTAAETGRYYVVGPPVHGQPDYLYAIAVATLHNGSRFREIFQLNQGRAQPDGGRLTDPAQVLHTGWILALPRDASGPRVLTGPLPLGPASSSPAAAPPPPPVTTRPEADGEPLLTYGGLTLAVLLVGFAVLVLRRRPSETPAPAAPAATSSVRSGSSHPHGTPYPAPDRRRVSAARSAFPARSGQPAGVEPLVERVVGTVDGPVAGRPGLARHPHLP